MAVYTIPQSSPVKIERTSFNMATARRFPATVGPAIPFYSKEIIPNDIVYLDNPVAKIKTNPFVVSLMGSFRVQIDWFFEPSTNLYGFMDNNQQSTTEVLLKNSTLHTIRTATTSFNIAKPSAIEQNQICHVPDCSLANFLYLPAGWKAKTDSKYLTPDAAEGTGIALCADRFLAYLDIYRTYYTNKQERRGMFYVPASSGITAGYSSIPNVMVIPQAELDSMFMEARAAYFGLDISAKANQENSHFNNICYLLNGITHATDENVKDFVEGDAFFGLGLATYRPDLMRSILLSSVAPIESSVAVENGMFTVNAMRYASHYQNLIDTYDISAGVFSDWMKSQWNVDVSTQLDRPILISSSHQYVSVDDVYATALTENKQYVGDQAGTINDTRGFRGFSFRSKYYGVLMGIMTIIPEVDYSQSIEKQVLYTRFTDIYNPTMAKLGFANMQRSEMCAILDGTPAVGVVAGRNVHWYEYMTDVNRNYGAFSVGRPLEHWALNRRYLRDISDSPAGSNIVYDPTTYVVPADWQYMFAYQSAGAQNWYVQIALDFRYVRSIPKFTFGRIV